MSLSHISVNTIPSFGVDVKYETLKNYLDHITVFSKSQGRTKPARSPNQHLGKGHRRPPNQQRLLGNPYQAQRRLQRLRQRFFKV